MSAYYTFRMVTPDGERRTWTWGRWLPNTAYPEAYEHYVDAEHDQEFKHSDPGFDPVKNWDGCTVAQVRRDVSWLASENRASDTPAGAAFASLCVVLCRARDRDIVYVTRKEDGGPDVNEHSLR